MTHNMTHKKNILCIFMILAALLLFATASAFAVSVPAASGKINSSSGACLRKSASTSSGLITVVPDNTDVKIYSEVFKSKTSTAKTSVWYQVNVNGRSGYIRSDLIDNVKYGSVKGKVNQKANFRKGPGTKMTKAGSYKKGTELTICLNSYPVSSTKGSSKIWYKVKSGSKYYYLSSKYVKLTGQTAAASASKTAATAASKSAVKKAATAASKTAAASAAKTANTTAAKSTTSASTKKAGASTASSNVDKQFEAYMTSQGFPESYKTRLRVLHKAHPNWVFVGYNTGISWSTALSKETKGGTSLVSKIFPSSYRDGSWQYERGWYKASSKVVAYYMDPRNFLNENSVYMFEDLTYKPKYQTATAVSSILSPTKLPGYGFTANVFVNAGKANNVSPVFLASRARQETGGGSSAITGAKILGKKVYNPFNIGAFGGNDPLYNGLLYAYAKVWTTPQKAVTGGAAEMAKNYINKGQYTSYYQRFNARNGVSKIGTHQYMTNIMAPYSEASSTRTSYAKYGILSQPLVFEVPIYSGMPSSTKLP